MKTLITSKTHKGKAACVGGLVMTNNRLVRLLNSGNWDQKADTDLNIGDIWDIDFYDREDVIPPHIEDVIIISKKYDRKIENISDFIINSGITIYRGSPKNIFNKRLGWTKGGSGYTENKKNLPVNSVGFWISNKDLILEERTDNKIYFVYESDNRFDNNIRFKYVGFDSAVKRVPAGTLMRLSLARWWKPESIEMKERCYLQLSGWYGLTNNNEELEK